MYKSFYNLNKKPFQISSDPAFMWFGEKHKEALATLKYGILDNKGFLLMTGDVGTGKTSLINSLIQSLSDDVICASVPDPGLEKLDFFNYIAASFGIDREFSSKGTFLAHFRKFLFEANADNKKVLLIIDEAQLLTQEMLEEIRLLSNIEKMDAKLINIFFIGQNEFNEILNREQNRAVRQRLTLNYNIESLTPDETGEYIKHRLSIAGTRSTIFDESAIQEVFMYSGGFPRRINIICDHSLLSGYVKEQKIINASLVNECAKELKIPSYIKTRNINGVAGFNKKPVFVPKRTMPHPPEEIENTREKKEPYLFLKGIICLLFVLLAGFFLFPDYFKDSFTHINQNATALKYKLSRINPKEGSSFLKQKESDKEETKETQISVQIKGQEEKEKIDDPIIDEPIIIEKIHPVQEAFLINEEGKNVVQPLKEVSEINKMEKEPEQETSIQKIPINQAPLKTPQNEISQEIFPLPGEKVIVRFKYNTNDFTSEGYTRLDEFADILDTHHDARILISGYTDSEGYKKYNQKLSEFRANIVKSFFLGRGIKPSQIQIRGMGSQNPIESNDTAWGRMMNRRVEIHVIDESSFPF